MSKWVWLGFAVLVVNATVACWVAWGRFSARSTTSSITQGQVVAVEDGYGRTPDDNIVATFVVENVTYTARGNSGEDSSLTVRNYPVGAPITVYYNDNDPSISSLTPGAGFGLWLGVAVLLVLVTGYVAYRLFRK
jgi:hypothetical protein